VWPAHKLVCGPGKAHPFAMLPLADVEIAKAKTLLEKRLHSVVPAVVQNLRSTLEKLSALPAEVRPRVLLSPADAIRALC